MMEQFQIEAAQRLARIEENVTFLKDAYVDEVKSLNTRVKELETFKDAINRKIAYIGGVLVTIGMFVPYVFNWIASHIHWKTP